MASRFQTTFQDRVRPAAERAFAIEGVYSDGVNSVTINAFQDSSLFESSNAFGITQTKTKDFLIEVAALILNSVAIAPAKGHTFTVGSKTYLVTTPPGGRPDQYDDDSDLVWRVHTTLKAT